METVQRKVDSLLEEIAEYVCQTPSFSEEADTTATLALADSIGCAILALQFKACTKLLGPLIQGTIVPKGCRVLGTSHVLDPVRAAFNNGTLIRWLDYNDTWLAAEWGHPSDNIGGLLAVADYIDQNIRPFTVQELLTAMIQAYEIQGGLALKNSFNARGFDHVILVKIATVAVTTRMLGGTFEQVISALSQAWIDAGPLRTYRHAPNTGSRKSWAAGDATSRGVQLAWITLEGEQGYATPLSAKQWGVEDVLFNGKPLVLERPLDCYVMENILFKISFPAEFHAQTAVEAAFKLHNKLKGRSDEIESITITTHASAIKIIDKIGPLRNPADRDHCLQYMVAVALLYGKLTADHYEEGIAKDSRIDSLREKMQVVESEAYSQDYLDPNKRSIANAITVVLSDGCVFGPVEVQYPLGHRRRRKEGVPLLFEKLERNLSTHYPKESVNEFITLFQKEDSLKALSVGELLKLFSL